MDGLRRCGIAAGLLTAAAVGVVACDPVGGLSTSAVAITTDQVGTKALKTDGVDVRWMSCTATVGHRSSARSTRTSTADSVASVDCQGEAKGGQKIIITGRVTEERDGRCVKGHLVARVAGRKVFEANVLGDCSARPTATRTATRTPTATTTPRPTVTRTVTPSTRPPSTPRVTVTVTATPSPTSPSPCGCTTRTMSPLSAR
jgi:hypothetical protein